MAYRKGQLSADFYVALLVFIGVITYITFQLFQITPTNANDLKEESLRIEAYQISEILINDAGHPSNWETLPTASVNRIGLSDAAAGKTNFVSQVKSDKLNTICSTDGYSVVKNKLDIADEMSITFTKHSNPSDVTWKCESPTPINKKTSSSIMRTVSIDGTGFGELTVEVWKK